MQSTSGRVSILDEEVTRLALGADLSASLGVATLSAVGVRESGALSEAIGRVEVIITVSAILLAGHDLAVGDSTLFALGTFLEVSRLASKSISRPIASCHAAFTGSASLILEVESALANSDAILGAGSSIGPAKNTALAIISLVSGGEAGEAGSTSA
jgi:hypothetical protein